ncbi:MAG: S1 RNA-binding domain-containing protein [Acidobacteriota bacterium]
MTEQAEEQGKSFGEILADFETTPEGGRRPDPAPGEKVSGTILSITDESVFVDLGTKSEAVIATSEVKDKEGKVTVAVGETIEATVAGLDSASGAIQLRKKLGAGGRKQARAQEIPEELRQAYALKVPVEGLVTGFNKGGAEVKIFGLRAFCPVSQLDLGFVKEALPYVGNKYTFRIIRLEEGKGRPNVVVSRRALLEEESAAKAAVIRATLAPGQVVKGKVTSLAAYGAFVDIGGIEGLLHVSEIAHARLAHPNEVLQEGQEVEVQITKIEPGKDGRERISLSRRALEADPWKSAAARFKEGMEIDGIVKRLETFGAFVEIAPGVEGLLHISELAKIAQAAAAAKSGKGAGNRGSASRGMGGDQRLKHAREGAQLGQNIHVKVLGVDSAKRRVSLGAAVEDDHADFREFKKERAAAAKAAAPSRGSGQSSDAVAAAKPEGNFGTLADFFKKAGLK